MRFLNAGGGNALRTHFRECEFMRYLNPMYRSSNIRRKILELLNGGKSIAIDRSRLDKPIYVSPKRIAKTCF
jgi:hypothetical protein